MITVLVFAAPRVFAHTGDVAFAAVKGGSVVTWGHALNGGDSEKVKSEWTGGVPARRRELLGFRNINAFAAVKEDGSGVTCGGGGGGGDSDSVKSELEDGVRQDVGQSKEWRQLRRSQGPADQRCSPRRQQRQKPSQQ